jgi:phospholipid/cholesterol/gamma-HCH transport system substrate-binding protein
VKAGDIISGRKPIETDEMLRTLEVTNKNVAVITENLKTMTTRINSRNSLWSLLMDTVVAENIKEAVVNIKLTGKRTAMITSDLSTIVSDVKGGKGNLGMLLKDTGLVSHLNETMVKIKQAGENAANITNDLGFLTRQVKSGKGTLGTLLIDTSFARKLDKSLDNVQSGTDNFNQDMEALKHNFLLRAYFRKKARTQKADTLH